MSPNTIKTPHTSARLQVPVDGMSELATGRASEGPPSRPHGFRFAAHPRHVEPLTLHEGDRYIAVEPCVAREMDALLCTFTEEAYEFVAPTREESAGSEGRRILSLLLRGRVGTGHRRTGGRAPDSVSAAIAEGRIRSQLAFTAGTAPHQRAATAVAEAGVGSIFALAARTVQDRSSGRSLSHPGPVLGSSSQKACCSCWKGAYLSMLPNVDESWRLAVGADFIEVDVLYSVAPVPSRPRTRAAAQSCP